MSQPTWGEDVCNKMTWGGATVELRVCDSCMSTRLMCELVALTAGLMWHVAENEPPFTPTREQYDEIMDNRWRAARHGLQATLLVDGAEVPVDVLLTRMVGLAEDGMRAFGVSSGDLGTLEAMVAKRQTQADFALAVFETERRDAHRFTRSMANIQRDPSAFERYLKRVPELPSVTSDGCERELLEFIGKETPYPLILRGTPLAPARLDEVLDAYVEEGVLVEGRSEMGSRFFTRAEFA
jgi:hypothetical protein